MTRGSAVRVLGSADDDLDRALLDEWAIWQRARNVSDKTITERVLVVEGDLGDLPRRRSGVVSLGTGWCGPNVVRTRHPTLTRTNAGARAVFPIKELMGHESLATTAIYVDVPLTQRASAVGLLPDLSVRNTVTGVARVLIASNTYDG